MVSASWGNKPTFSGDHVLEVNIFNFESDIYNKYLKLYLLIKSDQIKFNDKNELIEQNVKEDKKLAETY